MNRDYTPEQFKRDIATYAEYIERMFRRLKLVGIVPKDYGKHTDPLLQGIFVPLRVMVSPGSIEDDKGFVSLENPGSLIDVLKQHLNTRHPYGVLLGGPGSGKSTAVRHLVWSHAVAHKSTQAEADLSLLRGNPVPLCIELRRLAEEHRHSSSYDFLAYATDVLRKENIELNGPLFQRLLEQKQLLLMLDGLDEVPTLAERQALASEIEIFVNSEPGRGNYVIVTSRPIGYDLAPLPHEQFLHAEIQSFDDRQIRQFLENWYTYFLELSPIPPDDLQELEALYSALKDNLRLHGLAENPLLLTVIAALHRYERLPDRRVLVYDRCADLLLENWARLKGTLKRWQDMRLGKEDQYACVAHLGYTLHRRSQEEISGQNVASDVPESFLLQEITQFIKGQHLVMSEAEQHREARLFLDLIKTEAGLLVERGMGEHREAVYGFIHRTFQEYFAATHFYNRYLQEEAPQIISDFLIQYLHDPHWREVIFLLLGKFLRKPVTNQLSRILQGSIRSLRSAYTDLVQQDLFFVCDCLIEGITIEGGLVDQVLVRLNDLAQHSPFPSQREEVVQAFDTLIRMRQYANPALKVLDKLVTQHDIPDIETQELAARTLYNNSQSQSEVQLRAANTLLKLVQQPTFPLEKAVTILGDLYANKAAEMQGVRQQSAQLLSQLAIRSRNEPSLYGRLVWEFLGVHTEDISERIKLILELIQWPSISIQSVAHIIDALKGYSLEMGGHFSRDKLGRSAIEDGIQMGTQRLLTLVNHRKLSFDETLQISRILLRWYSSESPECLLALQMLEQLAQQPDLSVEQSLQVAETIPKLSEDLEERQYATNLVWQLIPLTDLSDEQMGRIFKLLYGHKYFRLKETGQITEQLLSLMRRSNYSARKMTQIARMSDGYIDKESQVYQELAQLCLSRAQQANDGFEDRLCTIAFFAEHGGVPDSTIRRRAIQMLLELLQEENLSVVERLQVVQAFYDSTFYNRSPFHKDAVRMLLELAEKPSATVEHILHIAEILLGIRTSYLPAEGITLTNGEDLIRQIFEESLKQEEKIAGQILRWLLQHPKLSFEQTLQVAALLYYEEMQNNEQNTQFLWQIIQDQRFTSEQLAHFAAIPLMVTGVTYQERAKAVQLVLTLLKEEEAARFFERYWRPRYPNDSISVEEIPYVAALAKQKLLPVSARDKLYMLLRKMVPEFDNI